MRIIVTNDDGIYSPGLAVLAQVASLFGEVLVMAPDVEQSAMSHAITIQRPLKHQPTRMGNFEAFRLNGTPADCVAMGLYHWGGADLVLSGVNIGSNLGHDIWHSGTVAAARQAALFGVRAVAFSLEINGVDPNFEPLRPFLKQVMSLLLEDEGPLLVNVNLPQKPGGIRWTHQSVRAYSGQVVAGQDPRGRQHYWFSAIPLTDPEEGSDRWAVENGLVSLTPLRLELTDHNRLQEMHPLKQGNTGTIPFTQTKLEARPK